METNAIPRLSVLIDTYNHERFIERAITSVLQQDMPMDDVEILVVDDGSTDSTPDIVRRFEPRVRLIRKANGGQASAFNLALPQAKGDIIAMLDGDDWWATEKLRRVLESFREHPEVGMVGHGYHEVYSDSRPNGLILPGDTYFVDLTSVQSARIFRNLAGFFGTSKVAIRRSVLDNILPIPEELNIEADEYFFTLAPAIAPAMVINEPLFYYGFHDGNLFQFQQYDSAKVRRKMGVLEVLVRELPPKLHSLGVTQGVIDEVFCGTRVDIERMRLGLDGGSSLRTFHVERAAYKSAYREVTWRYRLFQIFVLAQTLLLPPRLFYRLRRWYTKKGLSKLRRWTGNPVPEVQLVERRPG